MYVFFIEMFFIPSPNLGSSKLAQHEMQDIHIKAARASVNQSSIVASMSLNDDVETQKLKATFFHVLRIVMDGSSFRSSDPMSRKRSLYSVMFPDSKYTKINCGRTKATYILNHAIALFARKTLQDSLLGKVFGLFVDESTYHNKVRLEYWVIFFSDSGSRTIRYLSTKELDVNLDVKDFLSNTSTAVNSLDDLRLVDSEAVLRKTLEVMREFELQSTSLIFVMTDNCNVMTGIVCDLSIVIFAENHMTRSVYPLSWSLWCVKRARIMLKMSRKV